MNFFKKKKEPYTNLQVKKIPATIKGPANSNTQQGLVEVTSKPQGIVIKIDIILR